MRHGNKINNLGRKKAHRVALMKNMSNSLIQHKRITTTLAKAKALRMHIEPLLTKTKNDTTHNRRILFSYLQDKESIKELFGTIAERIADRPGGYTRVIKLGFRPSDAAEMAMIELVDFNELYTKSEEKSTTKTRRSRSRKGGSGAEEAKVVEVETNTEDVAEKAPEAVVEETAPETVVETTPQTAEEVATATEIENVVSNPEQAVVAEAEADVATEPEQAPNEERAEATTEAEDKQ